MVFLRNRITRILILLFKFLHLFQEWNSAFEIQTACNYFFIRFWLSKLYRRMNIFSKRASLSLEEIKLLWLASFSSYLFITLSTKWRDDAKKKIFRSWLKDSDFNNYFKVLLHPTPAHQPPLIIKYENCKFKLSLNLLSNVNK